MADASNILKYEQLFGALSGRDAARVVDTLNGWGRELEAAELLAAALVAARERLILFPGETRGADALERRLDKQLGELGKKEASRLRQAIEKRLLRVEQATARRERKGPVVDAFKVEVGKSLARFLGSRGRASRPSPAASRSREGGEVRYETVPGGEYFVGPPGGPTRKVGLEPFAMRCELVEVAAFGRFLEATGYPAPPLWGWKGLDRPGDPVVGVSFDDASAYASWVGGRLPTEAEWCAAHHAAEAVRIDASPGYELLLDDAGDPGGPFGTQGVILLGEGFPKCMRGPDQERRELKPGLWRADAGFRVVLGTGED